VAAVRRQLWKDGVGDGQIQFLPAGAAGSVASSVATKNKDDVPASKAIPDCVESWAIALPGENGGPV